MKFTIEGFSQKVLISMGLDHADALILQWFSDFQSTGKMKSIEDPRKGHPYQWVLYRSVIVDLPCLGITNTEVVARRFKKLCNAGVLESLVYKRGKTLTCYRKGQYFERLLSGAVDSKVDEGSTQKSMAVDSKVDPKTLLLDSSTKIQEELSFSGPEPTCQDLFKAFGVNPEGEE